MGSEYQPLSPGQSCRSLIIETPECFICRDVEHQASDPLRKFCDCKNLLAHQVCLYTWIQRGCGSEDRLRCIVCKAKYQLQKSSPWRTLSFQWKTWIVLFTVLVLMGLVPYIVYILMIAISNPPPPRTFKLATVSFGLLAEILLFKCLFSYLSSRYQQAEQNSFTVQARGFEEDRPSSDHWDCSESTRNASAAPSNGQLDQGKMEKSGCFSLFTREGVLRIQQE